jgi:ATP-dependent DNA helicase RecG
MRPDILNPLFASVATLPGVGPKTCTLFERALATPHGGEPRVADLLFHLPHSGIDRRARPN